MGRWAPDAAGRLAESALELYSERGYEQTTVAEIAERAGLTERTYFRHFVDKREVLFVGAGSLLECIVTAVAEAPPSVTAIEAVAAGLDAAAEVLGGHRDYSIRRNAVIVANPELQERELSKLAHLASAIAHTLGDRGVSAPTATLVSEAGMAVFKVAFDRWVTEGTVGTLADCIRLAMDELRAVAVAR